MVGHFGQFLKEKVIAEKRGTQTSFRGCTPEQIETLLVSQGVKCLPRIYIEFMEIMGHRAGDAFLRGEDYCYELVIGMKQRAQETINFFAEDDPNELFHIPNDCFVFFGHHDIQYFYFHTSDCNDDPPVFSWFEGDGMPKQIRNSLSEFYLTV